MSVHVLSPGLLTTVQDAGRGGHRHLGVGLAGALDGLSHALANRLVGNRGDRATLEATLHGPRLRFDRGARIALCGARIDAHVGDVEIPAWRPVELPAGSVLELGACRVGARAYLAIAGGFAVPAVLGSLGTDLRGGFGGMRGRALAAGDVLPVAASHGWDFRAVRIVPWWIDPAPDLDFATPCVVRVLPGSDATQPEGAWLERGWQVAAASDRQGLRLSGEPARIGDARERISEPVLPGTVQLPPDGHPIVLLADAQTHGGYPRIGHAIRADWPRLAQLRPGDTLRFEPCTPAQARALLCAQRQRSARIGMAIDQRLRDGRALQP